MVGRSMNALLAEFRLGWARATRGPLLVALLIALLFCLVVLPGADEGGLVRTGYGLVLVWSILLVVALWAGGSAYALDRERHRLTLTLTKPVRAWTLWWGRFIGTLTPFAVAVLGIAVMLLFRPLPEGRSVLSPVLPSLEPSAQQELARLRLLHRVPENVSEKRLLQAVEEELLQRSTELQSQASLTYSFRPNVPSPCGGTFRLSGAPFLGARDSLALILTFASGDETYTVRPENLRDTGLSLTLPPHFIKPELPVTVTLRRTDTANAASVFFRERTDLALLLPGITPFANLCAFCLILFIVLAMAVALGTMLGCYFSLPVTLFTGTLALIAMTAATLAPGTSVMEETATLWARISIFISHFLAAPFEQLIAANPFHALLEGEAIQVKTLQSLTCYALLPWLLINALLGICSAVKDETT
ncbi:MAG: hypothetical protein RR133_01650 [Kiritimatiellia bacterium]